MNVIDRILRAVVPFLMVGAVCALFAFGMYRMGYDAHKNEIQAAQLHATEGALKETWHNVVDAGQRDDELSAKLKKTETELASTRAKLARHLATQAATPYQPTTAEGTPNATPPLLAQCRLDRFTVRLLNDARAGTESQASATPGGDAEVAAAADSQASDVTGADLVDNDMAITGQYHDLAKRHDALVDWVNEKVLAP